jgi:hypothetical protein
MCKFGVKISAEIKMLKAECVTSYRTFQGHPFQHVL